MGFIFINFFCICCLYNICQHLLKSWFGSPEFSQSLLVCKTFFSFITISISCHSLLACKVSVERSAVSLMGIPLYVICCFSLAAFNICSLCLIFINLINMCLGVFHFGFILSGTLWVSWTWVAISFLILGKFSTIISLSFSHGISFCLLLLGLLRFECWGI